MRQLWKIRKRTEFRVGKRRRVGKLLPRNLMLIQSGTSCVLVPN
ncbi:hypothetical protein BDFB_015138 [Asbolus verrucosus]|uniref:Uncharacterized protein n=1 Tax=Asbolus verrucosus TaxID=1661398 RepID=A0A482VG66_ASBVE|nr:hypothetical protein BDFB_015138 [Asbolus verrucosus]